jgi:glyoxylase-like metal-dependent hydrolase (beta-lactamase superfamily II)
VTGSSGFPPPGGALKIGGGVVVIAIPDGLIYADGRAMFGDLPRASWEADYPPDARGRAPLALNIFLIRTPDVLILADTGLGEDLDPRFRRIYAFERGTGLARGLREAGVGAEDIDLVFHSHLHFDHCGGSTASGPAGNPEAAFPRARFVVATGEWAFGLHPSGPDKQSYVPRKLRALAAPERLRLVDGPAELAVGVRVLPLPGHTVHHQGLVLAGDGRTFCYPGDAVPTSAHLGPEIRMAFDLDGETAAATRRSLLERAAEGDWIFGFYHDARRPFGRVPGPRPGPGPGTPFRLT